MTKMTKKKERDRLTHDFMKNVSSLPVGERAALRRNVGKVLPQADGKALQIFYRCLPAGFPRWAEGRAFAAGCLDCLSLRPNAPSQPITCILRIIANNSDSASDYASESMKNRIAFLLDTKWDDFDGYLLIKLTRLLKMIARKEKRVDCIGLLDDLFGWNSDTQYVQLRWAREIFGNSYGENE